MTINFLARRRVSSVCVHESQMRIEIAGLSREVCEACGRVSVGYVGNHLDSETEDTDSDTDD